MGKRKRTKPRSVWAISPVERIHEAKSDKAERKKAKDHIRRQLLQEEDDEREEESDAVGG